MIDERLSALLEETQETLKDNILAYWMQQATDAGHGGFYGRISGDGVVYPQADKGAILHARILWTFSAAFRILGDPAYLEAASRAMDYLIRSFYDAEWGGVYWSVGYTGRPKETKKQIYALSFALYGFSEYYRATEDEESLNHAIALFQTIEAHSYDAGQGGYLEAFTRDWQPIADMRLSEKDANEKKTMNTHLHILEAYTNLFRVWKNPYLKQQLHGLIELFLQKIVDSETAHLHLFFNESWESKDPGISYGHDIEASWLLHEAALVLGDEALLARVDPVVVHIARAAAEGLRADGSMIYEYQPDKQHPDEERHWWVQAEAVVGFLNQYQYANDMEALEQALSVWHYISQNLIDKAAGEWHWSIRADGTVNTVDDKAGFWKCPYHNGRMCLEIIERFKSTQTY